MDRIVATRSARLESIEARLGCEQLRWIGPCLEQFGAFAVHRSATPDEPEEAARDDHQRHPDVHTHAHQHRRRVDAKGLHPEPAQAVAGDVEREPPAGLQHQLATAPDDQPCQCEVPKRFVEEGRMERGAGRELARMVPLDHHRVHLQCPGQFGGPAVQLLVEVVAETADGLCQRDRGRDGVAETAPRRDHSTGDQDSHQCTEQNTAGNPEAAVPDLEGVSPAAIGVERVPVGDDVVEPRTDQTRRNRPDGDRHNRVLVTTPGAPAPLRQGDRCQHSQRDHQPVEPEWSDRVRRWRRDRSEEVAESGYRRCHGNLLPTASTRSGSVIGSGFGPGRSILGADCAIRVGILR